MFRITRGFFGGWIVTPFNGGGITALALIIIILVMARFCSLIGSKAILPALLAFIVAPLLMGACDKLHISNCWLCILHGYCIHLLIDIVHDASIRYAKDLGLLWPVLLIIVLIVACLILVFLSGENFPIFFIIVVTNGFCMLNFLSPISITGVVVKWSLVLQIVVASISQIMLISNTNKKEKRKS